MMVIFYFRAIIWLRHIALFFAGLCFSNVAKISNGQPRSIDIQFDWATVLFTIIINKKKDTWNWGINPDYFFSFDFLSLLETKSSRWRLAIESIAWKSKSLFNKRSGDILLRCHKESCLSVVVFRHTKLLLRICTVIIWLRLRSNAGMY